MSEKKTKNPDLAKNQGETGKDSLRESRSNTIEHKLLLHELLDFKDFFWEQTKYIRELIFLLWCYLIVFLIIGGMLL